MIRNRKRNERPTKVKRRKKRKRRKGRKKGKQRTHTIGKIGRSETRSKAMDSAFREIQTEDMRRKRRFAEGPDPRRRADAGGRRKRA